MSKIIEKLKEPSTYRGLTLLGAIVGINVSPDLTAAIASAAVAIIGLIEVFRHEKPSTSKSKVK